MTATSIETVNLAKQAHASAVLDKIAEATALIRSEPELWFGGLPPVFLQFESMFTYHITQLREQFALPAPEPEPEPEA